MPTAAEVIADSRRKARRIPVALWQATRHVFGADCLVIASSLAFTTMLSIVPLAIIGMSIFQGISGFHTTTLQVKTYLFDIFVPGVGSVIESHVDDFLANATSLPVIGIPALFVSAGLLLLEIHSAFSKVWKAKNVTPLKIRLLELNALLTALPVLAVSGGWALAAAVDRFGLNAGLLATLAPHALVFIVFFCLYIIFPPVKVSFLAAFIGAAAASALFLIGKELFAFYISTHPLQNLIYGALAAVPLLQIWLLVLWSIIIFGAKAAAVIDAEETAQIAP